MTKAAINILEEQSNAGYDSALQALRRDTREWWESQSQETPTRKDGSISDRLLSFLREDVRKVYEDALKSVNQRATVRLQIYGESLDPLRLTTLHKMDERLARQFDQTLRTLERLQTASRKRRK